MTKTKVSFCGISGSGMSALAQILNAKGFDVSGSDRSFDQGRDIKQKQALSSVGIHIYPQDGSAITSDTHCLYVSTAVEDSIPDVKKALELNIPIKKRSDLLAEIFNRYPRSVAVGGTSGKTTVTAMIGYILDTLQQKPLVINGGLLKNYTTQAGIANVILNEGQICVAEADESDGSIEKYNPYIAVINNISIDHKSIDELKILFTDFARKAQAGAVINSDCLNSQALLHSNPKIVTFSRHNPQADIFVTDIKPLENGIQYKLDNQIFTLNLTGAFNVSNAAAAIAACSLLGINRFDAAKVLEGFLGTKRRLEIVGRQNGITVIDDFAHNPDKVKASMSALRDYSGRLLIMFQPHGFAPMRMMGREIIDSFASQMNPDDELYMPEIYYAGGSVKRDISSKDLIDYASAKGIKAHYCTSRDEAKQQILQNAARGDRIVIMGARDNSLPDFCQSVLEEL